MNISEYITTRKVWQKGTAVWKRYRRPFFVLYLYAVVIYLPMLVLRLTNDIDGLWNQDDYEAGAWELSIGRWLWPWIEKLRFGVSLDPMPGVVSLALYAAAFLLILAVLHIEVNWLSYLAGFMFLSNAAITCQMSHGYMVITFSLSTFLSVLAVWILVRETGRTGRLLPFMKATADAVGRTDETASNRCGAESGTVSVPCGIGSRILRPAGRILLSGICIALMMGLYQAEIGITCLVAMFVFLMTLAGYRSEDSPAENHTGSNGCAGFAGQKGTKSRIGDAASGLSGKQADGDDAARRPEGERPETQTLNWINTIYIASEKNGHNMMCSTGVPGEFSDSLERGSATGTGEARNLQGRSHPVREAFGFAAQMLAALIVGAVLYEILLHIHLKVFNMSLSSYQSFSEIGPAYLIANLSTGVEHAYRIFRYSLLNGGFHYNILQTKAWYPVVYIIPVAALVLGGVNAFRKSRWGGLWYIAGAVMIPLFAGSFYILAPDSETHMQMLSSYYLVVPLLLCQYSFLRVPAVLRRQAPEEGRRTSAGAGFLRGICAAAFAAELCVLVWGSVGMTLTDQYAMYAGRKASETLAEDILARIEAQGQDFLNGQIMILGTPADSAGFSVGDLYYSANSYAQYGNWSEYFSYGRLSWSALFKNYLRIKVTFATGDTEETDVALPEVAAMPVYPAAGCVQNIYGVTVVKISNEYTY